MGYAEKRGDYFRGRYKKPDGKYGTVVDDDGEVIRFGSRRQAVTAANDKEAEVRAKRWKDPAAGRILFGQFVNRRYAALDLARSTMQNYRHHLEGHILPEFEEWEIGDITSSSIDTWEKKERAAGYLPNSVKAYRTTLHTFLQDAVDEKKIDVNPATKRRGRGKRAGRKKERGPEKPVVNSLEALLIGERASLLSGRDDEFVLVESIFYTGARWGEMVGLELQYARRHSLRIERQLYELESGGLIDCPPKDDSYRTVDTPTFLSKLIFDHITRTNPQPCPCHGLKFVFTGGHAGSSHMPDKPVTMTQVAKAADVAVGTVSNVLSRPERVAQATRARVEKAIAKLGYERSYEAPARRGKAPHWRRSGFRSWVFTPAVSSFYPPKAPQPRRPVPVTVDPWPGLPVRGRNAHGRAEACWMPICPGLTPHLLRHSHRTLMDELLTPDKYKLERLGHEMEGMGGRYGHATPRMRQELMEELTREWTSALDARLALCPSSPVPVLDALLQERRRALAEQTRSGRRFEDRLPNFSQRAKTPLRAKPRKGA